MFLYAFCFRPGLPVFLQHDLIVLFGNNLCHNWNRTKRLQRGWTTYWERLSNSMRNYESLTQLIKTGSFGIPKKFFSNPSLNVERCICWIRREFFDRGRSEGCNILREVRKNYSRTNKSSLKSRIFFTTIFLPALFRVVIPVFYPFRLAAFDILPRVRHVWDQRSQYTINVHPNIYLEGETHFFKIAIF